MRIVTTHTNTDFDGLASMVAATCLYPGTKGVLPSHIQTNVRAFLAIHQDLFRVMPRKALVPDAVDALVVVDANRWNRLDRLAFLEKRTELDIVVWDHHMDGATISGTREHREEVGAAVTLLLEEMERQDTPFTPMHATLFLLGIYDDTGCLSFSSATPRDARMVGFLLENGADLNIVSAYLSDTMDDSHSAVFSRMLTSCRVAEQDGLNIGICALPVESGLTMLASLVARYRDFKGLDAVFGIFLTGLDKCMVIGRGNPRGVDVGGVVRKLGGGGHPGAGSAVVKGTDLDTVTREVERLIADAGREAASIGDIMSRPDSVSIAPALTMAAAKSVMEDRGLDALLVVEDDRFLGILSATAVAKAEKGNRLDAPVKAYTKPDVPRVTAGENTRKAMALMNRAEDGLLPVIDEDRLTGVLTRGNLILHIYEY